MGNNQSQQASPPPPTEVVRRPPTRPNAPPSARPVSDLGPKGPSYHSPENLVLPKDIPVLRLRPVSMELSKFHPEYKEIFDHGSDNEDDKENMVDLDEEEAAKFEKLGTSPPRPPPPILKKTNLANGGVKPNVQLANGVQVANGVQGANGPTLNQMPNGNIPTNNGTNGVVNTNGNINAGNVSGGNVNPVNVNGNAGNKNVPYRPSHRRQISLGQDHNIIMEEPEEIDHRVKLDPLMQSFPGATGPSLPVKNNFNLDYSYQLTYVQLAEHRRNKTIEELERKTGKKLSDLSADLIENQEQPFKRAAPSRVSSKSTGSGGSALSSKKKKAPEPPGMNGSGPPPAPPPPPTGASNTLPFPSKTKVTIQHQPYSVENEPPADYEIDSPRREVNMVLPRYKIVSRNNSTRNASPQPGSPTPAYGSNTTPRKNVQVARTNSFTMGKPEIILKKTPSVTQKEPETSTAEVPWLLQIKNLSETMSARRQQSLEASETPELPKEENMEVEETEMINNSNDEISLNTSLQKKMVYESTNNEFKAADKEGEEETKVVETSETKVEPQRFTRNASTIGFQENHVPAIQRQVSEPAGLSSAANNVDPVRRLNSLLQHDIKAAANAKCLKLKKQVTPVPPKPKDPHEVFREQLAKACAQRDERVKVEGTIDDKLKPDNGKVGKVMDSDRKDSTTSSEAPDTLPKPPRYHKNVTMNRNKTPTDRRQISPTPAVNTRASTALDWTPEDDLDSDDNLSDRETVTSKKGNSDGFKSTIVPSTVNDLKSKKKSKKEKKPKPANEDENNKHKFGSVKKFKKSMHKSVRNAFGSISKASGKILRKQKAEDLEQVDDAPRNWKLSHEDSKSSKSKSSSRAKAYMVPNGYGDSDSENEHSSHVNNEETDNELKQNGLLDSEVTSDNDSEEMNDYRTKSKVSNTSARQISPREQKYVYESEEELAIAKYKERKKKEKLKASVKEELEKERESVAMKALEEARERERKLELERRKQLEMELEIHKIREAETRERLQRLENAHLQQQLNAHLIQQQQQNMSMQLSAPPLPPAGNYGLGPDPAQTQAYTNLFGQQVPQNGYQPNFGLYHQAQTGPLLNGGVPGMSYDINDYMRMLGVQTPPTSQQMAYFLNSMTLTGQPFDRKSNPTLMDVINQQDPNVMKHYTATQLNYQLPDATTKRQNFQSWTSAPNVNISSGMENSVPMADFVASYSNSNSNGANSQSDKKDSKKGKPRNPLYKSDDSDDGLSPQRTVVRANVGDFRKLPARTESGKFMRQYGSSNYISKQSDTNRVIEQTNQQAESGLSQGHINLGLSQGLVNSREESVSPSNSTSTIDSAITSPSVTLSTPSSPSRSVGVPASPTVVQRSDPNNGFRTILDLTSSNVKTHVTMVDGELHDS